MDNVNVTKYPREVAAIKRDVKTLAIEAHFTRAEAKNDDTPLAVFDKSFSRIVVTGITKGGTSISANINVSWWADIFAATDYAYFKHRDAEIAKQEDSGTAMSPAYTVAIRSGILKGKTPAQVLLENEAEPQKGIDALNNQYKWLQGNLAKYPGNKEQMDAIADAARLFKEGSLNKATAAGGGVRAIALYKAVPLPLRRKQKPNGLFPIHEAEITWKVGADYPVEIVVRNYDAPVVQTDKGGVNVLKSKKDPNSYKEFVLSATAKEWMDAKRRIEAAMEQFVTANAAACLQDAAWAEQTNRAQAGIR